MKKVIIGISLAFLTVFIYSCNQSFEESYENKQEEIESIAKKSINVKGLLSKEGLTDFCDSNIGFGSDKCVKIEKINYPISLNTGDPCIDCNNILVDFEGYVCWNWDPDNPGYIIDFQVSFNKFEAHPDPSCTALFECWNNLSPIELVQMVEHFEYEASLKAELTFAINYVGFEKINPTSINFVFIKQNCYKTCVSMKDDGDINEKTKYNCGDQCCKRTRRMSEILYTDLGVIDLNIICKKCPDQASRFRLSEPEFEIIGNPCEDRPNPDCMTDPNQPCEQPCGPR